MKRTAKLLLLLGMVLTAAGCGNGMSGNHADNGNAVADVISEQIYGADSGGSTANPKPETKIWMGTPEKTEPQNADDVDYDLTVMSSDMVYATVYQMMTDPGIYIGKTFRMDGLYQASYYEPTKQYYHACVIQDATACCAQGMEFVWGDGSHVYPDEYPEINTRVTVQGTFEAYSEAGDSNLYCRLKDATLDAEQSKQ